MLQVKGTHPHTRKHTHTHTHMLQPVVVGARDECMTSAGGEAFYLGADDAAKLRGKRVAIVDDVVSTGG